MTTTNGTQTHEQTVAARDAAWDAYTASAAAWKDSHTEEDLAATRDAARKWDAAYAAADASIVAAAIKQTKAARNAAQAAYTAAINKVRTAADTAAIDELWQAYETADMAAIDARAEGDRFGWCELSDRDSGAALDAHGWPVI